MQKLEDSAAELKSIEEENKDLREGLKVLMEQFPQSVGSIRRISNSLVKISL